MNRWRISGLIQLRRWRMAGAMLVALVTLACTTTASITAQNPTEPTPVAPTPPPTALPLPTVAPNVNPLTGLTVDDPAVLERRPLIVKISNAPPIVRPQAGIGAADLVFEYYVEGGLTRFAAIFYSQAPARVGSIRSARLLDDVLIPMFGGIFAYSGASNGVQAIIDASPYFERTYKGVLYGYPYFWRDEDIDAPHNLFMSAAALYDLAAEEGFAQRQDLRGLSFDATAPAGATGSAHMMDIRYKATWVTWIYNEERGQFMRYSDSLIHVDANTGEQIAADNVIILLAEHIQSDIVESQWQDSLSYGTEIALWGEGDAIVFRDGQQYAARWLHPEVGQMLQIVTPDGEPMPLRPGITWFQVFPTPEQQDPAEESIAVS
ncbi:MAG: DUF3048 domain-containing protein [Anaerolineae bacterium]|nr:DUF3048 domain-containing protein [Anaerolineae bacterium]